MPKRMNRSTKRLFLILTTIVSLVTASLMLFEYYPSIVERIKYVQTPLRIPVKLQKGAVYESSITFLKKASYRVELDVERKIPFDKLCSLLGIQSVTQSKKSGLQNNDLVDISWVILDGSKVVATDKTSRNHFTGHGYFGPTIGKELGVYNYRDDHKQEYIFRAVVNRSVPQLEGTNPHLQVSIDPLNNYSLWDHAIAIQLTAYLLLLTAFVVFAYLVREVFIRRCDQCGTRLVTAQTFCGKCGKGV